jgi:hypothetical protein
MNGMNQTRGVVRIRVGALCLLLFLAAAQTLFSGESVTTANDETLCCALQEGETTFILPVPKPAMLAGFKVVNENPDARGQLKIAVADTSLPANDPHWNPVNGKIAFANKRLFNLSLLGVQAKYVKLSFYVESTKRIAGL